MAEPLGPTAFLQFAFVLCISLFECSLAPHASALIMTTACLLLASQVLPILDIHMHAPLGALLVHLP